MAAIDEMVEAGLIPPDIGDAWADVDSGVPERVARGNTTFLYREQHDIIEQETLPRYQELLATDPDRARAIIGSSVPDRIDDYRMTERIDEIVGQMLDWDVDVDQ